MDATERRKFACCNKKWRKKVSVTSPACKCYTCGSNGCGVPLQVKKTRHDEDWYDYVEDYYYDGMRGQCRKKSNMSRALSCAKKDDKHDFVGLYEDDEDYDFL